MSCNHNVLGNPSHRPLNVWVA